VHSPPSSVPDRDDLISHTVLRQQRGRYKIVIYEQRVGPVCFFEFLPEALLLEIHRSQSGGWPYSGDVWSGFQYPSTKIRIHTVLIGYYDQLTVNHELLL
jgi:hypothetical protein